MKSINEPEKKRGKSSESGGYMKEAWTEKDVENLIQNSAFPNPAQKDALRRQLFDKSMPLDLEDLEMVAGGKRPSDEEKWEAWPEPEEDKQ